MKPSRHLVALMCIMLVLCAGGSISWLLAIWHHVESEQAILITLLAGAAWFGTCVALFRWLGRRVPHALRVVADGTVWCRVGNDSVGDLSEPPDGVFVGCQLCGSSSVWPAVLLVRLWPLRQGPSRPMVSLLARLRARPFDLVLVRNEVADEEYWQVSRWLVYLWRKGDQGRVRRDAVADPQGLEGMRDMRSAGLDKNDRTQ